VGRLERWGAEAGRVPFADHRLDELLAFVEAANGGPLVDDIACLLLGAGGS
jgi:hypothetical protein